MERSELEVRLRRAERDAFNYRRAAHGFIALLALVVLAATCAGCGAFDHVKPDQQAYLASLRGRPITDLTAKMGPPSSQQLVGPEHWYTWSVNFVTTLFGPNPVHALCKLSVNTDAADLITSTRWEGNVVGCQNLFRSIP